MPMPLNHATVIQQINFAEWAHRDLQVHPETTMLKARDIHSRERAESLRRANPAETTRRSALRLHGQNYNLSSFSAGGRVDLKA